MIRIAVGMEVNTVHGTHYMDAMVDTKATQVADQRYIRIGLIVIKDRSFA